MNRYVVACCLLAAPLTGANSPLNPVTNDLPPAQLGGQPADNPLRNIDDLIQATEKTLADQKQTRQMIVEYMQVKAQYLQNQEDRERVVKMIKSAHGLLETVKANHLQDAIDPEFMRELTFFSQIVNKKAKGTS